MVALRTAARPKTHATTVWTVRRAGPVKVTLSKETGDAASNTFAEPQDIVGLAIAFYKGAERAQTLNVYDNGNLYHQITSSGLSDGYQEFALSSDDTAALKLCLDDSGPNGDEWLSITEVGHEIFSTISFVSFFVRVIPR